MPDLVESNICLAWRHRGESPWIRVQGGVNSRMASTTLRPRAQWCRLAAGQLEDLGLADKFAHPDFDPDIHYFVTISAGHQGTEDWPIMTPRMRFPAPPEQMDAWVAASIERCKEQEELRQANAQANNPWVCLRGLRTEALNGSTGIRGAWDGAVGRWAVELRSGKVVSVKPENVEIMEVGDNVASVETPARRLREALHDSIQTEAALQGTFGRLTLVRSSVLI